MEEHSKEVTIYKDGESVAHYHGAPRIVEMQLDDLPKLTCFGFPTIALDRRIIFQLLNRRPLMDVFNGVGIEVKEEKQDETNIERTEPVYLVHGRQETYRGETTINAVVLAYVHGKIKPRELATKLPEIYRRFSASI